MKITQKKKWLICIVCAVFCLSLVMILFLHTKGNDHLVTCVEDASVIPKNIAKQIEKNTAQPGIYTYQSENTDFAVVSLGDVSDLILKVNYKVDKKTKTVKFQINPTRISDSEGDVCVYKVYRIPKGYTITANEDILLNPYYGEGSQGINIGWIDKVKNDDKTEETTYILTPLLDTKVTETIFKAYGDANATPGLCYIEYVVKSDGPYITKCSKEDFYNFSCKVKEMKKGILTVESLDEAYTLNINTDGIGTSSEEYLKNKNIEGYITNLKLIERNGVLCVDAINEVQINGQTEFVDGE